MWYAAVGKMVYKHYYMDYHTARCAEQVRSSCEQLQYPSDGIIPASFFWPIAVPVSFAVRNPILVALLIPGVGVGGYTLYKGHQLTTYLYDDRRRKLLEKQKETEKELKEATDRLKEVTDYLRDVDPEFAYQLERQP